MERTWGIISCSYSGKKKEMKRLKAINKDVYLYYGVTEEDIRNKTERYQELVTVLATQQNIKKTATDGMAVFLFPIYRSQTTAP